jgi:hypothetical protein
MQAWHICFLREAQIMKRHVPLGLNTLFVALAAAFALALTGCASATVRQFTDKPFVIDNDDFYRTVKVIALEPMMLPDLKQAERVSNEFEWYVSEKLRQAGFTMIPSGSYRALWYSFSKQAGDLYDPLTGRRNDAKIQEIQKRAKEELVSQYQADAILRMSVITTTADFYNCVASWHGTEQGIGCNVFGTGLSGKISAISLLIQIERVDGTVLFKNAGGIQPIARAVTGFMKAEFKPVEADSLFLDTRKNRAAVSIALEPLVSRQADPASKK